MATTPSGSSIGTWKKMGVYLGSSIMLALGYADPGNWASDIAAGSQFGFRHLFIVLLSSLIAIFLQTLCLRIGIVTGIDLAAGCRERYSRPVSFLLWISAEIAIAATDMAEVIGSAVALKLLFGLPTIAGVWVTALDVLLLMAVSGRRFYILEITVAFFACIILVCFTIELALVKADPISVLIGFLPSSALVTNADSMLLAISILGATVMPHNLYLHSSLVINKKTGNNGAISDEEEQSLLSLGTAKLSDILPASTSSSRVVDAHQLDSSLHEDQQQQHKQYNERISSPAQEVEAAAKAAREGTGITDSTANDVATTAAIDAVVRLDQQSDGSASVGTVSVPLPLQSITENEVMDSIRAATIDTARCLFLALFVNAAILITAAAAFHTSGHDDVATLEEAYEILGNVLPNGRAAAILFGIALLASGQSSTITGTIAGQVVMEGFLQIKVAPNLRRLLTRLVAIIPSAIAAGLGGDSGINMLLIVSQVVLSFQLPFAVIPLLHIVSDEKVMGKFSIKGFRLYLGWGIAILIISLNCWLIVKQFIE